MQKEIIQFIQECEVCQRNKSEHLPYLGLLQPLPILTQAWSHITMDFIEKLPCSKGFDTILVVIDRLTKFGDFIPLAHLFSTAQVAQVFLNNIYKLHGLLEFIVTNTDKIFTSKF